MRFDSFQSATPLRQIPGEHKAPLAQKQNYNGFFVRHKPVARWVFVLGTFLALAQYSICSRRREVSNKHGKYTVFRLSRAEQREQGHAAYRAEIDRLNNLMQERTAGTTKK